MRTQALVLMVVAGCSAPPSPDVAGPFLGTTTRFYVSKLWLPQQRTDYAVDLDADGRVDNQLGNAVGGLAGWKLDNPFVDDLVAARTIDASVDIISSDPALRNDAHVGVRWNGARGIEGDDSGGMLRDGVLTSNAVSSAKRSATGVLEVPLFADADATQLPLESWQLELWRQDDGRFTGELQAVVAPAVLAPAIYPALRQMIARDLDARTTVLRVLDLDRDGDVSFTEFATSGLVLNILAPDTDWGSPDRSAWSVAVAFELAPCVDAACTRPLPAATCHDRIKNGDETKVDCGGSCDPCP